MPFNGNKGRIYNCGDVPPLPKQTKQPSKPVGFSLLSFLTNSRTNRRRDAFSESGWHRRIERGEVSVDGTIVRNPGLILSKERQNIKYHRRPWKEPILTILISPTRTTTDQTINQSRRDIEVDDEIDDGALQILHIDDHLLVVNKPSGLPTMPSQTYFEYSVLNALRRLYDCDIAHGHQQGRGSSLNLSNDVDQLDKKASLSIPQHFGLTNVVATGEVRQLIQSHCSMPPQPVHRLGVGTSGVLVLATSLLGRQTLTNAIRLKSHSSDGSNNGCALTIRKVYRALVYAFRCDVRRLGGITADERNGPLIPDKFTIDCPIGLVSYPIGGNTIYAARPLDNTSLYGHVHTQCVKTNDRENNKPSASNVVPSNLVEAPTEMISLSALDTNSSNPRNSNQKKTTKSALSHVRVLCHKTNNNKRTALVEVEIFTGRPHQIRIHLAYAGYPLVGDPLYLPGGVPNTIPQTFPTREKEEEDMDTDDDEVENSTNGSPCTTQSTSGATKMKRVALPRDCGYHLHAHTITLDHPSSWSDRTPPINDNGNSDIILAPSATPMTFVAPPPPCLREDT